MEIAITSEPSQYHKAEIYKIWNAEYPSFLAHKSISEFESYLKALENARHFIATSENNLIGWIVKFDREGGKWFVLMISSKAQNKGLGTILVSLLKGNSDELNGWVIDRDSYLKANGEIYKSPLEFYTKNGFETTNDRFKNEDFEALKVKWVK